MNPRRAGVALSLVASALSALIALATTPVIVRALGVDGFGAYAMALALLAVFVLFDGGLTDVLVRFATRHRRRGEQALTRFIGRTLPLYFTAVAGLVAVGSLLIVVDVWFSRHPSPGVFALCLAGAAATILANPFKAAMIACERFVAARLMEMTAALATAALCVCAAWAGGGPGAVLSGVVAGLAGLALARAAYVRYRLGIAARPTAIGRAERRAMRRHATPILLAAVVDALYWRIDTLLIGWILGPAAVASYAIALMFQKHILRLSVAITRVMVPSTMRAVDAGATPAALADRLARVARGQGIVLGTAIVGLVAFGDRFLAQWLGPGFEAAYGLMLVLLVPFALVEVGSLRNVVLQVRGLYAIKARQALAVALANVAATAMLLPLVGPFGAALATAAGLLAALGLANRLLAGRGGVDVGRFHRRVLGEVAPFVVTLALAAALIARLPLTGWAGLAGMAGLYGLAALAAGWTLAASAAERAAVRQQLAAFAARMRRPRRSAPAPRPGIRPRRC